ncbi:MAG: Fic family protein [Elusimicrobiota bacterium]
MTPKDHYDVSGLPEAQFEPGSRDLVLKNLLGIRHKKEMDLREATEQIHATEELFSLFDKTHRFIADDIRRIHKLWLGRIYPWAGHYRQVNLSKGHFPFPPATQVPRLMAELEKGPLAEFTPCARDSVDQTTRALAVVHVELVLVHPFRDGNGRAARMVAVLMGSQAGLPPLDFAGIQGQRKEAYFAAVRAGLKRDYQPMEKVFREVIVRTLRMAGKG